jgi:drug/metabolite transporter (DMT)-like permease
MRQSHRVSASTSLALATAGWALAPIFIRNLSVVYDPHTQNFLRYGSALIPLVVISLVMFRRDLVVAMRDVRGMAGISLLNLVQQYVWTLGCAGSTATTAQLVSKLSIVLVIIFSFALFHEERTVIKSPIYLLGTALSFAGVAAVISRDPKSIVPALDTPTLMLLATAVLWAVYTVWAKHLVTNVHPVPMFTVVSAYTTFGYLVTMFLWGDPSTLVAAGSRPLVIGVVSGLIPIALAHPCFHFAQKHLGSALCTSINLFNPLLTYAIALCIWADERLILTQWLGAAILLFGTFLVIAAGKRVAASAWSK